MRWPASRNGHRYGRCEAGARAPHGYALLGDASRQAGRYCQAPESCSSVIACTGIRRGHRHFQSRTKGALEPGYEYALVDEFADMLKMRDWYQWIDDEGAGKSTLLEKEREDAAPESGPQGTTNPELLRSLDMASTMYLLAALQRFEKLPVRKVKEIAFEIAVMGMSGLDYAYSEKKYRLNALPGESFSGLELICLMHAGLRQAQPDADTGMDLDKPFEAAKQLHSAGKGQSG